MLPPAARVWKRQFRIGLFRPSLEFIGHCNATDPLRTATGSCLLLFTRASFARPEKVGQTFQPVQKADRQECLSY